MSFTVGVIADQIHVSAIWAPTATAVTSMLAGAFFIFHI